LRFDLEQKGKGIEKTDSWHQELLERSHEEHLIDAPQFDALGTLPTSRYVQIHDSVHMLDEARLRNLAANAPPLIRACLEKRKF